VVGERQRWASCLWQATWVSKTTDEIHFNFERTYKERQSRKGFYSRAKLWLSSPKQGLD
jgi:hypothetical protein